MAAHPKDANVPIITLTLSTLAQQKLDEQNSEFDFSDTRSIESNPPEYTSTEDKQFQQPLMKKMTIHR